LEALSGVWQFATVVTSNSCGLPDGSESTEPITLIQSDSAVSIVTASGLWGSGTVRGQVLDVAGSAIETDESGCRSTQQATGSVSGSPSELEGSLTVTVSYDSASCGSRPDCTISQDANLLLAEPYRSSCIDRDTFGPPADSEYVLPFPVGAVYRMSNSYCWPAGGHREQLAYDFAMPIGDPVVAARAGVVRTVKNDSPDDGQGSDHNHIMVEHEDGTVGFYAHLQQASALVQPGDTVQKGQPIANNGHSGTTDIPHLHFGVYAGYPPTEGADRAVNFRNTDGPLDCRGGLVMGESYRALVY
jgi:murein DD-endopeptidase MepM/ murein hydrolase activator NlpD